MAITDIAKTYTAAIIGGSSVTLPTYFIIGTGSAAFSGNQTALVTAADRQAVTSTDATVNKKVTWIGDWNSVEMSGLLLTEFGMIGSAAALTGSIWSRTSLPAITFDGTNELRIQETWEVY